MSEKKYHDAIRKKLESIEPEYQQSDWEDLQGFMATQTPAPTFWQLNGKNFLLGTTAALLVSSLFFNLKQFNDNKLLLSSSSEMTNVPDSTNATPNESIVQKTDTVYIERFITKYIIGKTPEQVTASNPTAINAGIENETVERNSLSETPNPQRKDDIRNVTDEITVVGKTTKSTSIITPKQPTVNPEISLPRNGKNLGNANPAVSQNSTGDSFGNTGNNTLRNVTTQPRLDWIGNKLTGVNRGNELLEINKTLPRINSKLLNLPDENSHSHITIRLPKINFKNMKYRYGISGDVGTEQWAAGVTNELLITPNWAISAGLRANSSLGKEYFTAEQFNQKTGDNFVTTYTNLLTSTPDILNIKFQNYFLQLPLAVSYRRPLAQKFTVFGTLGTDLEILGRQYVTYDYSFDKTKFEEGNNQTWVRGPVFSNVVVSLGLEKKYRNYVVQLSPYFMTQFKESAFKREDVVFGAKLKLMLQTK